MMIFTSLHFDAKLGFKISKSDIKIERKAHYLNVLTR